ncbi:Ig-like domain-containing protein, partial [Mesorhizobium sp. ArgA1]
YSYTLIDNTLTDPSSTSFAVVVTDADGDPAPAGNLVINIVDDVPTAVADTDAVAAGSFGPVGGNVIDGSGSDGNAAGADTKGADGATVVGVQAGNTNAAVDNAATLGVEIQGTYGKLTLAADGTYSYVRDAGSPGGVNDVFTYTIKDGDGDTSHTTLTISIGDGTPTVLIPVA